MPDFDDSKPTTTRQGKGQHQSLRQSQRLHLRQNQRLHLHLRQNQRLHLHLRQSQRLHLHLRQNQRLHLHLRQSQRLHLHLRQSQPAPAPKPTPAPAPKPTVAPLPTQPIDGSRPVNQAWGKPNTGLWVAEIKKMLYLTQSSSILEAAQKLGTSAGFQVLWPTKKRHYGTYDMVEMVVNIGAWLRENVNDVMLSVADTAAKEGGSLGSWVVRNGKRVWVGHASHKTGMDIDLGYLTRNPKLVMNRIDIPNKGGYTHSEFLAAEQWRLIKAVHEFSPIEVIYVNRNVKNEMCRQALKAGDLPSKTNTASPAAKILTKLIVEDTAHGNHWHVRLDCSVLKFLKLQTKCIVHPQAYVGPECKNVKL
jgi:murein endopeptidase